jgi:hypothetical protein
MRERIEHALECWGKFAYRRAGWVLAVSILVVAALATQLPKIAFDTSTEGFFTKDDPIRIAYDAFRERFGSDTLTLIAVRPPDVFDLGFLEKLRAFHEALEDEVPLVVEVTSLINARETRGEADELIVGELLEDWPTSEADLAQLKQRVMANPLYVDQLVSRNAGVTTVVIESEVYSRLGTDEGFDDFDDEPDGTEEEPAFLTGEEIESIVTTIFDVAARHRAPDFELYVTGTLVMTHEMQREMRSDMARFTGLALAMIAFFLGVLFRRVAGVVLPIVTVLLSVLATASVMVIAGIPLTLTTQILPSFLLAVGVGGSVHILAIFYQARRRGESKEDSIAFAMGHSGLAVAMTSFTTAGGLVSFAAADLQPIAHFGYIAPAGIMVALLLTLGLLPALIAFFPMRSEQAIDPSRSAFTQRLVVRVGAVATRHAWATVAVWGALLCVALLGMTFLRLSHAPFAWFPEDHPTRIASDLVNDEMNGALFIEFLVDSGRENGVHDPDLLLRLDDIHERASNTRVHDMYVGKTLSVVDVVKEIHQALNENQSAYHAVPGDPQLVAQELLLFENSGSDDLENVVDPSFQVARVTMKLPFLDAVNFPPLYDILRAEVTAALGDRAEFTLTGLGVLAGETIVAVMHSMLRSYAIALAVICPLLVLLIGNLRLGLVAVIPNLAPIILVLGLMGWTGVPLDMLTMLIGSIAIGLAVDDTIHFMHNFRRYYAQSGNVDTAVRETLSTTGQALLFTSLVLSSGFFLYWFATLLILHNFGLLTAFTIIAAFLADILLAPALMVLVTRSAATSTVPVSMEASP